MKHTSKKTLSIVLCLLMVLSLLPVAAFAATPSTLYLKPNSNWTRSDARFAAYFFNNSTGKYAWVDFKPVPGDSSVYQVEVPDGFPMVIFVRMNPSSSKNDWNGKWNQTGDLTIPTNGNNCFTMPNGSWDGDTSTWGSYTPPGYYLVGAFSGNELWFVDASAADRMFAATEEEGILELVYTFAASDQYKVVYFDGYGNINWPDGDNLIAGQDGELTMRYEVATGKSYFYNGCDHEAHDQDGNCANCGEYVGHSFVDGVCSCGKAEEVVSSITYIVAGTPSLCGDGSTGFGWDPADINNLMTDNGDGTFSKVYSGVAAAEEVYEFKVTTTDADGKITWYGVDGGGDNMVFNVTDTCDVTVTFDPATLEITVTGEYVTFPGFEVEYITATGNGDGTWLNGAEWNPGDESNCMTEIAPSVYQITYTNVECFDGYQVKFTADGGWANNWGGVYVDSGIETDAVYNSSDNITIVVPYELADVTLTLDLSNYDHNAKTGAKFTITVTNIGPDCEHTSHNQDGICANCGEYVGHSFVNGACDCGKVNGYITVYFRNNWNWSNVSAFYLGSDLYGTPNWPGVGMDIYSNNGVHDIYYARIPADCDGLIITGTKDDGSGALDQTPTITDFSDGICYYMRWADKNLALTQTLEEAMAGPHNVIHVDAVPATCDANGNIEYWYCADCGQAWLDADCTKNTNLKSVVVPTQGHSFSGGICGNCGEADPDYVPPVVITKIDGLTALNITRNSFDLTWTAAEGVNEYWVFINGMSYASSTDTTITVTKRQVNTAYDVFVIARMSDNTFLSTKLADVLTVTTADYSYSSEAVADGTNISATYTAEDCEKAWFLYGTSADNLVVYDCSTNGTFTKKGLKANTTYFTQIAYLIDGKVIYGEIMEVTTF